MRPNSIIQATKPEATPLELSEAKRYLKITHNHDDELLTSLIFAVGCKCETYTGLSLINKDWRAQYINPCHKLYIPIRPLQVVTMVNVPQSSGPSIRLSNNMFQLLGEHVLIKATMLMDKINIHFTAGFGDTSEDIPADLKIVMLEHLADLYETRGNKSNFTMDGYNEFRPFKI